MAQAEYEYGGETQGATQQASQPFYTNDVHPMDRPFFGCLQPCNSALRRIDFVKTKPIVRIGRGPNNDFTFPGMRISAKPFLRSPPSLLLSLPPPFAYESRLRFFLGIQVSAIVR